MLLMCRAPREQASTKPVMRYAEVCYSGCVTVASPFHPSTLPPTQAIILEQAAQRELKVTMAAAEKDINTHYDDYAESMRKMGQYTDAEVQAGRAEMRTRVMEENLKLAASQSASKSFLTTQVYKNSVDPSFFDQFGKTSR